MPPSLAGPPLMIVHGFRCARQAPAYSSSGFDQFIAIDEAPVFSLMKSTLCQVLPPSLVRKIPRSAESPNGSPTTAAYAMSGFLGWTTICEICPASLTPENCHVFPASIDL